MKAHNLHISDLSYIGDLIIGQFGDLIHKIHWTIIKYFLFRGYEPYTQILFKKHLLSWVVIDWFMCKKNVWLQPCCSWPFPMTKFSNYWVKHDIIQSVLTKHEGVQIIVIPYDQYDALIGDGRAGEEAPLFEGGVHVRTCRCTPPQTCVTHLTNGYLVTHKIWTQSAQPFARYGRGVCTCARADALHLRHV